MKYIFLIIALVPATICNKRQEHIAKAREWGRSCQAESKVDQEVLNAARTGDFTDDANYKEYLYCYLKKMQLMNDNGDVLTENFQKLIQSFSPARIEQIMNVCAIKRGKTPSETAFLIFVCYHEIAPEDHVPGSSAAKS